MGQRNPYAQNGTIDLSLYDFNKKNNIQLKGEWDFYWNEYYNYNDLQYLSISSQLIEVPSFWKPYIPPKSRGKGFGTYRLKVKLPEINRKYGLLIKNSGTSYKIFIDSLEIGSIGSPGNNSKTTEYSYKTDIFYFTPQKDEINIIIHMANFHHRNGGLWDDIKFGFEKNMKSRRITSIALTLFLIGSFFTIGLYNIILFLLRKRNRYLLFFGMFAILLGIHSLFSNNYYIYLLSDIHWRIAISIEYLTFYIATPVFGFFIYSIYPRDYSRKFAHYFFYGSIIYASLIFILPITIFTYGSPIYEIVTILLGVYIIYILYNAHKKGRNGVKILFIGFIVMFLTVINDILNSNEYINSVELLPFGLFIFILFQAYLVSSIFAKKFNRIEKLTRDLNIVNQNLETLVDARTMEVSLKNEAIEEKNIVLEDQKHEISLQKDNLETKNREITSSISYASKIQNAILPEVKTFREHFQNYFIVYKPRDIISGDFYWIYEWGEKLFFALADCTGHGVPGAFMSILGFNLLNEVLTQYLSVFTEESFKSNQILNILRKRLKKALHQTSPVGENQDGIDISFCMYDKLTKNIQFAGANPFFYLVRNKNPEFEIEDDSVVKYEIDNAYELVQLKGDRMPVGVYLMEKEFTNYSFKVNTGEKLYLYSDGLSDLIGGERDKKFLQKRVRELIIDIHTKPMKEQETIINKTITDWVGTKHEQLDDISMLGIEIK
ncbi:7TM diverse intracellular signaling domain-containing protein [Bacteroidota bacterium]